MRLIGQRRRSAKSLAISIVIHVIGVTILSTLAFKYPLGQISGLRRPAATEELRYVELQKPPTENSGIRTKAPNRGAPPAPLVALPPTTVPSTIPPLSEAEPSRAAGGVGDGFGVSGSGLATGVVPRSPDPRLKLTAPDAVYRMPRGVAEDVDSIIDIAVGLALDSLIAQQKLNAPVEWIKRTKDGKEWGLTPQYIALGKFKIPTVLLALLPLNNIGPSRSPVDVRSAAYIRRDVLEGAQRSISEAEFKAAIKRIRERKEAERNERPLPEAPKPETKVPVVPSPSPQSRD